MKTVLQVEQEGNKSNLDWLSGGVLKFGVDLEIIIGERVENKLKAVENIT